jgi:hypothetical protein
MSIALTEELLGFGGRRGWRKRGRLDSSWPASGGGGGGGGGGSLLLVKAAVLQELEPRRSKSALLPGERTRMSGIGGSFMTSFRDIKRESDIKHETAAPAPTAEGITSTAADGGDEDATTDHRDVSSDTEGCKKVNKIMLGRAVESIPAYIERSSLIVALAPPCKHAERKDEICDEGSWRGRGWCRVEYLGAALVRSDVSVMVVSSLGATQRDNATTSAHAQIWTLLKCEQPSHI